MSQSTQDSIFALIAMVLIFGGMGAGVWLVVREPNVSRQLARGRRRLERRLQRDERARRKELKAHPDNRLCSCGEGYGLHVSGSCKGERYAATIDRKHPYVLKETSYCGCQHFDGLLPLDVLDKQIRERHS